MVLALGRLASNKGYDLLVRGFKVVTERYPDATLLLAVGGESPDPNERALLDELRALVAELGLDNHVVFGNYIADEDLADYYRAADVFVLSSRYEPFGMTAIEAMACGTPCVITCHGGLWRVIHYGRHALIADPFDRADLGVTISKLLRFPKMARRISHLGARRARGMFTWTGIAQQLVRAAEERTMRFKVSDAELDDDWLD